MCKQFFQKKKNRKEKKYMWALVGLHDVMWTFFSERVRKSLRRLCPHGCSCSFVVFLYLFVLAVSLLGHVSSRVGTKKVKRILPGWSNFFPWHKVNEWKEWTKWVDFTMTPASHTAFSLLIWEALIVLTVLPWGWLSKFSPCNVQVCTWFVLELESLKQCSVPCLNLHHLELCSWKENVAQRILPVIYFNRERKCYCVGWLHDDIQWQDMRINGILDLHLKIKK